MAEVQMEMTFKKKKKGARGNPSTSTQDFINCVKVGLPHLHLSF